MRGLFALHYPRKHMSDYLGQIIHRISDEIDRAAQTGLRTHAHKAIGQPISNNAAVVIAIVRLNSVICAEINIVVINIDTDLIFDVLAFHGADTIPKSVQVVVADYISRPGQLDPFAQIVSSGPHGFRYPHTGTFYHIVGDITVSSTGTS